ncbi:hypothetical protein PVAP13_5KG104887 [Panicum virgatum]|uniref:Uncharacterized protein n=1 Tax=Panicum virgatum TaxID=38727 RepID=A0A8T0SGV4_PANVG|nr:hypothetical protein PVAP13_5KG104887 [Panicum virgatum]
MMAVQIGTTSSRSGYLLRPLSSSEGFCRCWCRIRSKFIGRSITRESMQYQTRGGGSFRRYGRETLVFVQQGRASPVMERARRRVKSAGAGLHGHRRLPDRLLDGGGGGGGGGGDGPDLGHGDREHAGVHGGPDAVHGGVPGQVEPAEERGAAALDVVPPVAALLPADAALPGDDQHVALVHLHPHLLLPHAGRQRRAEHVRARRVPALDVGVGERRGVARQPRVGGHRRAEDAEGVPPRARGQRVEQPFQRHPRSLEQGLAVDSLASSLRVCSSCCCSAKAPARLFMGA